MPLSMLSLHHEVLAEKKEKRTQWKHINTGVALGSAC